MTLHPDALLGRDFTFNRMASPGVIRSRVTITAFDPAQGWQLASRLHGTVWVPTALFARLLANGVLEAA